MKKALIVVLMILCCSKMIVPSDVKPIDPFLVIHTLPANIDVKKMIYRGVFNGNHMFIDVPDNAIYLLDVLNFELKGKFYFRFGRNDSEVEGLKFTTQSENHLWVLDQMNRISLFDYVDNKFIFKASFFLTPYTLVTNIYATKLGLFAFGRDSSGLFSLNQYSMHGSKEKEIETYKAPIPGNIVFAQDHEGNLLYTFQYNTTFYYLDIVKDKTKTYKPDDKIIWEVEKKEMYKNGMVYNIGLLGPNHLFISYWTVPTGGIFAVIDKKSKNVLASYTYPLAEGFVYNDRIFIYKETFQDKNMQAFLVELRASDIIKK